MKHYYVDVERTKGVALTRYSLGPFLFRWQARLVTWGSNNTLPDGAVTTAKLREVA